MIQLDLISGFLGVGKTTFANMLLKHYMDKGFRPVFIVNEFGQTGLDAEIIKADGFNAIELEGGCICCTLKYDVAASILDVIAAFSPTHIVFEPSGIFIFDNFFDILKDPSIRSKCELGNVFTVVDSVNFSLSKVKYGSFIYNQIKNASIILLSKLERTTHDVEELICDIKNINPDAFILSKIWADWDATDWEMLLNQEKYPHKDYRDRHHNNFRTLTIKLDQPFTQDMLDRFIAHCKASDFGDLCRVKGIIKVEAQTILLNIAVEDAVVEPFKGMAKTSLTFIGQKVSKRKILKFLKDGAL